MNTLRRFRPLDGMVLLAILSLVGWRAAHRPSAESSLSPFAQSVDLSPLYRIAVQADGRMRSFESHAKTYMGFVTGPRQIDGQSNGFSYLDLVIRPERYADKPLIFIKNKGVREQILETLEGHPAVAGDAATKFRKSGLISRRLLAEPRTIALLQKLGADLIRTAKQVDAIQSALSVSDAGFLADTLRVIAPPSGDAQTPWLPPTRLSGPTNAPMDDTHAKLRPQADIPGLSQEDQGKLRQSWVDLVNAWRSENAEGVNTSVRQLASLLPGISPAIYPSSGRLAMESWYYRYKSMTWVWWFYALSMIPLLMSVIYGWSWARKFGMVMFVVAFAGHTASLAIRWYISGRWPNSNMFEAVHTSAWLGGVAALLLEWFTRRAPVRNLFALASATMSMAALMAAYFLPVYLDTAINNKMAALNDVWLYIHTNMIILSYALIGLACVPALLSLRHRWCLAWDNDTLPKHRLLILPLAVAGLNYASYRLLMHTIDPHNRGLAGIQLIGIFGLCLASAFAIILELLEARARSVQGIRTELSAAGGAASLILGGFRHPFLKEAGPTAGQVFDGATMVILELSFITLWTGIVMGAIWADHSWGRPWGWDPKEVFALNTFFIFLILIHVRLKVRDKAFWAAVLAVVGFQVMMFNWIVVNFIISGLHSYA